MSGDARSRRRGVPIHAYVGPNGGGKSAAMVFDTLPSLDAGRPVLSTVQLLVPASVATLGGDRSHPLCELLTDFRQFLGFRFGDVLLDEVTGVASSRESQGLPVQIANRFVQLRRDDVALRFTSPNYARADVILRECCQAVTYCRSYLPKKVDGRLWRQRRLAHWLTYDAAGFEDFTSGRREKLRPIAREWHRLPGSPALDAYDTYAAVAMVGVANTAGMCLACGGRRTVPRCGCSAAEKTPALVALEESVASRPARRPRKTAAPVDAAVVIDLTPLDAPAPAPRRRGRRVHPPPEAAPADALA